MLADDLTAQQKFRSGYNFPTIRSTFIVQAVMQKMNKIIEYVNKISPLDAEACEAFISAFKRKEFPKGSLILDSGQVCRNYYFIETGLIKSYFYRNDSEFIMTFFRENMLFTEFSSFLTEQPSKYLLVALEDTTLYAISKNQINELCKKHHSLETLFSKLYSFTALKMMKRISELLEENATERYNIFTAEYSELLQRVSLGNIADYLGISQVSLSRIRANK